MYSALKMQKEIYNKFQGEYFFCSLKGKLIDRSNIRFRIWNPALKKAGFELRSVKQTRHSFATVALSCGENPLWIANTMGHRDTEMLIKVYSKFVADMGKTDDGLHVNNAYSHLLVKNE